MPSIGSLYAPAGAATNTVNSVVAYLGLNVDRPPYKHFDDNKRDWFLKDFPHGKIPAFKSKEGLAIVEGPAISRYLIATYAPGCDLIPSSLDEKAHVDQWCHLIETEMRAPAVQNFLLCTNRLSPFVQEYSDLFKEREERALNTVNNHLEGRTYLVGDQLTLADIELAATIKFTIARTFAEAEREKYKNVLIHFERLAKVPALEPILGGAEYAMESLKHQRLGA